MMGEPVDLITEYMDKSVKPEKSDNDNIDRSNLGDFLIPSSEILFASLVKVNVVL